MVVSATMDLPLSYFSRYHATRHFGFVFLILSVSSGLLLLLLHIMGSAQEIQIHIKEPQEQANGTIIPKDASLTNQEHPSRRVNYRWWLLVSLYTVCLLIGQSGATLLGRFYYDNGGKSKWMATLVQSAGFPLAIPFLFFSFQSPSTSNPSHSTQTISPSIPVLALLYLGFGIFVSVNNLMYSYGQYYLPVSTYSLLCASQLAFNALFSYFLNSLKFTSCILNSVVLLTISASILATNTEDSGPLNVSPGNHIIGLLCTIGASALYSLGLSVVQLCFKKLLRKDSIRVIMEIQIYPAMFGTSICIGGLFVSKEWRGLTAEMDGFKTGKVSYVMTLFWTAVLWEVFSISCLGLIYEASSLLSNVVSTVGLPIVPILAVVLFNDKMDGMKIVAMILAVWGFISYFYQHYLDDSKPNPTTAATITDA